MAGTWNGGSGDWEREQQGAQQARCCKHALPIACQCVHGAHHVLHRALNEHQQYTCKSTKLAGGGCAKWVAGEHAMRRRW